MKLSVMKKIVSILPKVFILLFAWAYLYIFKSYLLKKNIWLIMEKMDEARDNGYHFYKFLKRYHPEINSYYVIKKDSPDYYKVAELGNVIEANSFLHCVYYLAAHYSINSQPCGAHPFYFNNKVMKHIQKLCNAKQKVVFLQHGIIKDGLSPTIFYNNCNIDLFICSAQREFEFIKDYFGYPASAIASVGLCRFDNLYESDTTENIILIMPTWRKWLKFADSNNCEKFLASEYYLAYSRLLCDKSLHSYLDDKGYKVIFYLHYQLQKFSNLFKTFENDYIKIARREEYDVQELLKKSKVLVTDYSSVFFDFGYMKKPILYYQFDREKFFDLHYSHGYFSYIDDGFGDCCDSADEIVLKIKELISLGCVVSDKYIDRINNFFKFNDNKNCERTFNAIINME